MYVITFFLKEDGTLPHSISSSHFPAKKKHIVKLQIGWVREGTDCWQQSNSLLKGFPLFTAQHQLQKKGHLWYEKCPNDDFVTELNFLCENWPVYVLTD